MRPILQGAILSPFPTHIFLSSLFHSFHPQSPFCSTSPASIIVSTGLTLSIRYDTIR